MTTVVHWKRRDDQNLVKIVLLSCWRPVLLLTNNTQLLSFIGWVQMWAFNKIHMKSEIHSKIDLKVIRNLKKKSLVQCVSKRLILKGTPPPTMASDYCVEIPSLRALLHLIGNFVFRIETLGMFSYFSKVQRRNLRSWNQSFGKYLPQLLCNDVLA